MKRNESVLVYGVTGLLLLILVVAIVFGNGRPARAVGDRDGSPADGALADGTPAGKAEVNAPGTAVDLPDLLNLQPEGDIAGEPDGAGEAATVKDGQGAAPSLALDHRARVLERTAILAGFGASRRERDYRVVVVQAGDTFRGLVRRWCAGLERLELARALNEDRDLARLRPGQEIWLPWVDDEVLVERQLARTRRPKAQPRPEASDPGTYVIRPGDALWKIAVKMTGDEHRAPAYIERIKRLNPGLSPKRLRVGRKIKLPVD